jgi:predicted nucleotidyltransferase
MLLQDPLAAVLFSKSQSAVLGLLFGHPDESYYLRQVAQLTALSVGNAQRELNRLAHAGVLLRNRRGMHVYFQANPACPLFPELRSIVAKTIGAAGVIRQSLASLQSGIRVAFIFGSVARGHENAASDLDLMVIGDASFADVAAAIKAAELQLLRPINPSTYPAAEFRDKLSQGHHFLTSVVKGPRIFVLGCENELRDLLEERLDQAAPDVTRRNPPALRPRRPRHRSKQSSRP